MGGRHRLSWIFCCWNGGGGRSLSPVRSCRCGQGTFAGATWRGGKVSSLGLYKGYWATLGSFGPFSALYFVFYEKSKSMLASAEGVANQSDLSVQGTLLSSAGSGSAAAVLTNPLDMAKLRFQTQRNMPVGQAASGHLRGLGHALQSIYAEEGFLALFRGAGARVLFHTPNVCVTFTIFEQCRKFAQQVI